MHRQQPMLAQSDSPLLRLHSDLVKLILDQLNASSLAKFACTSQKSYELAIPKLPSVYLRHLPHSIQDRLIEHAKKPLDELTGYIEKIQADNRDEYLQLMQSAAHINRHAAFLDDHDPDTQATRVLTVDASIAASLSLGTLLVVCASCYIFIKPDPDKTKEYQDQEAKVGLAFTIGSLVLTAAALVALLTYKYLTCRYTTAEQGYAASAQQFSLFANKIPTVETTELYPQSRLTLEV